MKKAFRSFKLAATFLAHLLSTRAPEHCTETHPLLLFLVFVIVVAMVPATSQHVSIRGTYGCRVGSCELSNRSTSGSSSKLVEMHPRPVWENKRDGEERSGCFFFENKLPNKNQNWEWVSKKINLRDLAIPDSALLVTLKPGWPVASVPWWFLRPSAEKRQVLLPWDRGGVWDILI